MRERDLQLLEYETFLNKLQEFTLNEKTKQKIASVKPEKNVNKLKKRLNLMKGFLYIFNREGYFPLSEYPNIEESLKLLYIEESVLSSKEILDIAKTLSLSREIKNFLKGKFNKENEELSNLYKKLYSSREIEKITADSIDDTGFIKDSASRDLARIRKEKKAVEQKIISILEHIIHNHRYEDILQEKLITVRKDRYVIPVKENFSSKIKGIIHDRSSTGHTIFLEPLSIVELNNKLSDLKIQEQIEIRKILKFLTDILRKKYQNLKNTFEAIIEFDFLYTIAKYAKKADAVLPEISNEVFLKNAKHPLFLLSNKYFNPIDLIIENSQRGVVITGPNTGGKTVALKTLGIISLLFQSGIPVPVDEDSKIPVFSNVFVDIGDYQSIQQDLSTYSWHISNIKEIVEKVDENSLVLLDELIPGTDPDEGSSIGIGILNYLKNKKAYIIATSHFKQIKMYALSDDYFKVASVGFDKEKLKPTYQLLYNSVGQSMAFYIAEKLGLKKEILEFARKILKEEDLSLSKALEEIENLRVLYEKESQNYKELSKKLKLEKEKYEKLNKELEELKRNQWKQSINEIKEFVKNLKKEGYSILEEIKTSGSGKELESFSKRVFSQIEGITEKEENHSKPDIDIGDKVRIKGKNTLGEVISLRETKANVNFNGIKMWIPLKDLEKIDDTKSHREVKTKFNIKRKKPNIKNEINLIGLTRDEAIQKLSSYLDEAVLAGFSQIRIIHGYGTGVLRRAVREYLDICPYNIKYKDADYSEGGMGVTIAEIL